MNRVMLHTKCGVKRSATARLFSIVLSSTMNNVTTITMNNPKKLNGWTDEMMTSLSAAFDAAKADPECKVMVLTGADPYYCAGVNLAGTLKPMHPSKLFDEIIVRNQAVFDGFLNFHKPIVCAPNGPVIGASCTTATLCDAIIASEKATFLTPFGRLGVTPEGCSSVHFEYLMGAEIATKMLVHDWAPTASEAKEVGLITEVVPHDKLMETAQNLAEKWIEEGKHLKPRTAMGYDDFDRLRSVNAKESLDLAHAFLGEKFLQGQVDFLTSKGKTQMAMAFKALLLTRPLWRKLDPRLEP